MSNKLHMTMAGIVATGLLALGTPASAATPATDVSPGGAGGGHALLQQRSEQARRMGARDASDLVRVRISRDEVAPTASASAAGAEATPLALQNAPYVVWVQNQTSVTIEIRLYWVQSNVSGVLSTSALLNGGAQAPYVLGGGNGCDTMLGYILEIWYQGEFYAATDVVEPSASDGYLCSDFWGVA